MLLTCAGGAERGGGGEALLGLAYPVTIALDSDINKRVLQKNEVINTNTKNDLENLFPFKRSFKNV
jgi:hypothetical protein